MSLTETYPQAIKPQLKKIDEEFESLQEHSEAQLKYQQQIEELIERRKELAQLIKQFENQDDGTEEVDEVDIESAMTKYKFEFRLLKEAVQKSEAEAKGWGEGVSEDREVEAIGWAEGAAEKDPVESSGWSEGVGEKKEVESEGWPEGYEEKEKSKEQS